MAFPDTDLDVIVEAYLGADPTADPQTWPAATDLSSRLMRKPIQIRRGRGQNQKTAQAGSCTLWLDNTDGALTPLMATSTYYPDWDLGVPLRVLVDNVGEFPPYVRHAGFVADITAVMVPGVGGENISAVRVTSAGVLRRLGQGEIFKSALRRVYLGGAGPTLSGYWPCEDEEGSTVVASGLPSGQPLSGVTPHFEAGAIGGSTGVLDLTETGDGLNVPVALSSPSGFQVEATFVTDAVFSTVLHIFKISCGNIVDQPLSLVPALADGTAHHIAYRFVQSGSDVIETTYRDGVAQSPVTLTGFTLTSSLALSLYPIDADTGLPLSGEAYSAAHVAVYSFADMDVPTARVLAVDAYADEQAHERIERVCDEEGIPFSGTATSSIACGAQPIANVVSVLQDAETTDHGMLTEDFAWGLGYRAGSQRYNLDPALTVDLSTYRTTAGTQADVLAPVRNDARIRNEWTVRRPDGSEATAKDKTHQAKRGRYNDSDSVNVAADTQLPDEAAWRVHEGTFDGLRYDTVPLDIAANLGD